jgi:hypothetical protein
LTQPRGPVNADTVDQAPLPQAGRERPVERARQTGRAVADPQQRGAQASADQVGEEVVPGVGRLRCCRCQADEHRLAIDIDAPGGQDRLGRGARVHLEVAGIKEQVVQPHPGQVAGAPGGELLTDRRADPAHRRLRQRGLGTQDLSQGGLDVPVRQTTHPAGDHQRLQGVGPGHPGAEQPRAERLVGAAQLGTLQLDRAHRRLDTRRWLPAVAASCGAVHVAALVAGPAEERVDLGLEGGLHHQPHAQPGNVLQDRREVTTGAEQLIDLGAQPVGG